MTEKEILKQEELDFAKVFDRFFRSWPLILLSVLGFMVLAVLFVMTFPPSYSAKASYLIDKPLGMKDPGIMMVRYPTIRPIDDYYYMNQKHALTAYPVVKETVERLGMHVTYIQSGIFDKDIYERSPLKLTLDSNYWNLANIARPTGSPFYVDLLEGDRYFIEVEGEYPITEVEYEFSGEFSFGEWVTMDRLRFKLEKVPAVFQNELMAEALVEETFGFKLNNVDELSLALQESIVVEPVESESTVLAMTLSQPTPRKALDILETLSDVYIENGIDEKVQVVDKALEFLRVELDYNVGEAARLNKEIEELKITNGFTGFQEFNLLTSKESLDMEEQKVSLILKERYYEYLLEQLESDSDYGDIVSPSAFGIKDQLLNKLTSELVDIVQERDAMKEAGTQANPAYDQILAKIEADRRSIIGTVRGFQESNQIAVKNLDARIAELDGDLRNIPKIQNLLMAKDRMIRIHESLISNLRERISSTTLNKISITSDVRLMETPFLTSLKPIFPDPLIILIVAILLGLMFPILYILAKTLFSSSIDHSDDVLFAIPEPMRLGEVANSTLQSPIALLDKPEARLAQDVSRVMFTVDHRFPGSSVIALTSYRDGEGKSYISNTLAIHSAQHGHRTLIIDAYPSFDSVKELVNGSSGRGLADVLSGNSGFREGVVSSKVGGLDVMPSGSLTSQHLESGSWTALVEEVKAAYDRVFVVTAPFGTSASVYRLMENMDLNVVVARRGVTRFDDVEHIAESIDRGLVQRPGVLVTDTFDSDISLSPLSFLKQQKAEQKIGLLGYINRLFKRV